MVRLSIALHVESCSHIKRIWLFSVNNVRVCFAYSVMNSSTQSCLTALDVLQTPTQGKFLKVASMSSKLEPFTGKDRRIADENPL